jgi:hypothetical protein
MNTEAKHDDENMEENLFLFFLSDIVFGRLLL